MTVKEKLKQAIKKSIDEIKFEDEDKLLDWNSFRMEVHKNYRSEQDEKQGVYMFVVYYVFNERDDKLGDTFLTDEEKKLYPKLCDRLKRNELHWTKLGKFDFHLWVRRASWKSSYDANLIHKNEDKEFFIIFDIIFVKE